MRNRSNEWPPPPIVPIVLYHGEGRWNRSTQFDDLFELGPELFKVMKPFIPKFSFLLDDLSALPDEELKQRELTARAMLHCLNSGLVSPRCTILYSAGACLGNRTLRLRVASKPEFTQDRLVIDYEACFFSALQMRKQQTFS